MTRRRGSLVLALAPIVLALGYALLGAAWVVGNPPFAGPDESAHYRRAVGLAGGQLVGDPAPDMAFPHLSPAQASIVAQQTRLVTIPAGLSPRGWSCFIGQPVRSAACLDEQRVHPDPAVEATTVGTYQPAPYLLPGLAARAFGHPASANVAGRALDALVGLLLVAAAACAAWHRGSPWALLGVVVAVTPMVVFTVAALNPSGVEITASLAFVASLLRIGGEDDAPVWVWTLAAVSGALLCLSRSLGPVWAAGALLLLPAWHGRRTVLARLRTQRSRYVPAAALLALAVLGNLAFEAAHGADLALDLSPSPEELAAAVRVAGDAIAMQAVGVFGYAEVSLPPLAYHLWRLLAGVLLALALVVGSLRHRLVLAGAVLAAVGLTVGLEIVLFAPTEFSVQGRHMLPALVIVPLLSGDAVGRAGPRFPGAWLAPAAGFAAAGLVQAAAWYTNAHRAAVGVAGSWRFLRAPEWDPPAGWLPWLLLAGAGALLIGAAGLIASFVAARTRPAP